MVFSFIARRFSLAATASIAARSGLNTAFNLATRRTFSVTPRYLAPPEEGSKTVKKTTKKTTTKTDAKKSAEGKKRGRPATKKKPVEPKERKRITIPKELKLPKGAPSPYLLFYAAFLKSQAHTEPKTIQDYQALSKRAGEVWRGYSLAEKQPFYDEHEVRKVQAHKEREEFFRNVDPAKVKKLNKLRAAQGKSKVRVRNPNPKPASAFVRFIAEFRASPDAEALIEQTAPERKHAVGVFIAAGTRWRSMTAAEKEPFYEKFREAKEEYDARNAS